MISKQQILDAYHNRYACKSYDPNKKISQEDLTFILETARLSPSSFGLEPWRFLVIENQQIKELIRDIAWGAKDKIMDCSHFIVILARQQSALQPGSEYIRQQRAEIMKLPAEVITLYEGFYRNFCENEFNLNTEEAYYAWASRQCYIALGNMLTSAAMIGIDSTPIEGFPLEKLNNALVEEGLYDPQAFKLSVMAAFGYRTGEPRAKTRRAFDDVVSYIK
ncbi:NAD(P)H-dependent oxidoreductase [Testudinibacter sp. TR-2022]|uniref:NAD(P)H-dependent oxidoreductase n=1 Tax=Testudinibacter sp. TR-2022 TaxID=2585029 RepID=UPI00111B9CFE|nr:NAD(P)H-dependent oxidoreductase [Testudinibacter sp. TR-2022]TNH02027.1 NAD(P)H-dependent oxidoreductase [Pasteurellaceae bacterium Phil31]TNH09962.1 NAD(P)H-dependent oxidoreductase [Testudinibacter sp. TR-2022]TNH12420.1 NAD(P)H-dependent oxidoreductase [Testudinibacter sp. TR-2022]TNH16233.1 NAD(P)H-dependent oxidoreductase [Testudinibacter sp. TR-2022]TNH19249.1 NAD(P)H-dependent oxidoreductase [Testudinibacter sp. TR-2022]